MPSRWVLLKLMYSTKKMNSVMDMYADGRLPTYSDARFSTASEDTSDICVGDRVMALWKDGTQPGFPAISQVLWSESILVICHMLYCMMTVTWIGMLTVVQLQRW